MTLRGTSDTASVVVKLVGGPCGGWVVPWPEGKDFEHFTIAPERGSPSYMASTEPEPITSNAQTRMYVLTPGREGEAHFVGRDGEAHRR